MSVQQDYDEFFGLLNDGKVKYLVVGAHAVSFHGRPRFTGDLAILVERTTSNARRLLSVLKKFGFGSLDIRMTDLLTRGNIIQLGYPPARIDILTDIDGVRFSIASKDREAGAYGRHRITFISRKHLIKNKRASGRARDLLDLHLLDAAQ